MAKNPAIRRKRRFPVFALAALLLFVLAASVGCTPPTGDENPPVSEETPDSAETPNPVPEGDEGRELPEPKRTKRPDPYADPYVPSPSPSPTDDDKPEEEKESPKGDVLPEERDEDETPPEGNASEESENASEVGEHESSRTDLVDSIRGPLELTIDPRRIAETTLLTGILLIFLGFPSELFNATLLENYDEISGWFGWQWLKRLRAWVAGLPEAAVIIGFAAVGALIHSQLEADLSFEKGSLALLLGLFVAFITISLIYDVMRKRHLRRRYEVPSRVRTQLVGMVVALLFVVISRVGDFHPGYMYGLFTALTFSGNLREEHHGRALAIASLRLFVIALVAWCIWIPVKDVAEQPDASFFVLTLDAMLSVLWVAGIAAIVFGLMPLRFLYGETVKAWSFRGWLAIWIPGVFLFVYTLLHPERGLYGSSHDASFWSAMILFFGFGLFSVLFWGYFRARNARRRRVAKASGS